MFATRPDLLSDFNAPSYLTALNTSNAELLPGLTQDELVIVFDSDRSGGLGDIDLWTAQRSDTGSAFSSITNLAELNSVSRDTGGEFSSDGLTIYFSSNRAGSQSFDIWYASRPDTGSSFSAPQNLSAVNSVNYELDPAISAEGSELFFSSSRSGKYEIWRSVRQCL